MKSIYLDLTSILNHALERASENLSFNRLLVQIGVDPSNVTFDAVVQRLVDIVVANINVASMCALVGAGFYAATMLMRTMVPLRVFGIISALFFMAYGAFAGAISTFLMYLLLLPINSWRLYQMRSLVKRARIAAQGDLSMDWLKPFMNQRAYRQGRRPVSQRPAGQRDVSYGHRKIPGDRNRRRAAAGTPYGRAWFHHAQ